MEAGWYFASDRDRKPVADTPPRQPRCRADFQDVFQAGEGTRCIVTTKG